MVGRDRRLYIELFHGREAGDELEDWGEPGPVFGPCCWVHTTYANHIRGGDDDGEIFEVFTEDDMIYYDGMWYGDWSIFPVGTFEQESDLRQRLTIFDPELAKIPEKTHGEEEG